MEANGFDKPIVNDRQVFEVEFNVFNNYLYVYKYVRRTF